MGYYINPKDKSKEAWLVEHGTPISAPPKSMSEVPLHLYVVCLVDNGMFTAAGIAYNERELRDFSSSTNDDRPKLWFLCDKREVEKVSDI